jgi:hypothetical protein
MGAILFGISGSLATRAGPDSARYYRQASQLAAGAGSVVLEPGKELYPFVLSVLFRVLGAHRWIGNILSMYILLLAWWVVLGTAEKLGYLRSGARDRAPAALLYPGILLFGTQALRESTTYLGVALVGYAMVSLVDNRKQRTLGTLVAGLAVLIYSRPVALASVAAGAIFLVFSAKSASRHRFKIVCAIVALGLVTVIVNPAGVSRALAVSPAELSTYRQQVSLQGRTGLATTETAARSWLDVLQRLPRGLAIVMVRPNYGDIGSPVDVVGVVDTAAFWWLLLGPLRRVLASGIGSLPAGARFIIGFAAMQLVIGAAVVVDFGLLVRLRATIVFSILPVALLGSLPARPDRSRHSAGHHVDLHR